MSIVQFLRIFWARRLLIVVATVSCVIGAYTLTKVLPPTWEAHSRVMMGLLKPDPVTGRFIGEDAREYVVSQIEMIKDYSVGGRAADLLDLQADPSLIAQSNSRSKRDTRDFRRWLADLVVDHTKVSNVDGSNILDISYRSNTPDSAKLVADTLRKAYIDASLEFRRTDAARNAAWYEAQAEKVKTALNAAEAAKTDYERKNGIVMADEKTDVDSARLRTLAAEGAAPTMFAPPVAMASPSAGQLAAVDAQIAQASKTLGPNHPELQALRATRAALAQQVARDEAASRAAIGAAANAAASGAGAIQRALKSQEQAVIGKGDKLGRLAELQTDVDLLMDQYTKVSARAAEFRQESAVADTGLTPLGEAVTPRSPMFPKMMLIIPGSVALGLATGLLVALLVELFNRRVREIEDMRLVLEAPLLAVIERAPRSRVRSSSGGRGLALLAPWKRRAAPA